MRFNRQAGAVFEAFLELRERALQTERTARAVSTRQHLRNMRAALFAWQHYLSTKTIRINQGLLFVRRNCNSVFHLSPPGLDRFFREWYQQSSRKARSSFTIRKGRSIRKSRKMETRRRFAAFVAASSSSSSPEDW